MPEEVIECGPESLRPMEGIQIGTAASGTGYDGRDDLLMAAFAPDTAVAGVLTTSRTAAAPIRWNRARLDAGCAPRGLVVNAGNANCFNGAAGPAAVAQTTAQAAALLGCAPEEILVGSTGKIGVPLDMAKLKSGVAAAHAALSADGWKAMAGAIMTTDRFPKAASTSAVMADARFRLQGATKGSTMIAPSMATTLSFLFTDAPLAASALQQALSEATAATYNSLSVDNTQSTNDMILLFRTGAPSGSALVDAADAAEVSIFQSSLQSVLSRLMQQILDDSRKDGTVIRVTVAGAESPVSAQRIGRYIADSYLVRRMAAQGGDFAMGRIVAAVGMAGEPVEQSKLVISVGGREFTRDGGFIDDTAIVPLSAVQGDGVLEIGVDVGVGRAEAVSFAVVHENFV
ncbi:MAG: bifunctional ornithine acetyltransferase/N-acetylglutamate synthase [Alphaproteobacteria bacterium]|nr:bifunctional ornithine acetyltransferase/N-acetylglutamate synthase [Alphaproteobacteria bacterium]